MEGLQKVAAVTVYQTSQFAQPSGWAAWDGPALARCGLRALHGGMWAVLSALSIAAMLFVALAPVEKMRGLYCKGGEATPQPCAASGTGESDKGAKGSIRGVRRRFILA